MKRILSLIIAFCMVISCMGALSVTALAESGTCGAGLTWTLDDEGTLTISGTGEMDNWSLAKNAPWYGHKTSINKVVIGEGVTTIGEEAFDNYDYITEVSFPSTLAKICEWAFFGCDGLKKVTIPPSVNIIEWFAFSSSCLESIEGYTYSAAEVFANEEDIEFISLGELPEAVISEGSCGEGAVYSLTNRNVLTVSGEGAISGYDYEEAPWSPYANRVWKVVIEDGITAIGDGSFNGCIYINDLTIADGVESIGSMAFYGCWKIEELELPSALKYVGENAFDSTGMTELVIPKGTVTIEAYAFAYAPLETITIPESVIFIGEEAFGGGGTYPVIKGAKGSYAEEWANSNGFEFKTDFSGPVEGTWGNLTWVFDTDGTFTILGEGAMDAGSEHFSYPWYDYEGDMKNIIIGSGITSIPRRAFYGCSAVERVEIPYTVASVGSYAFYSAPYNMVVAGYDDTTAEEFAQSYGFTFESLGEAPCYDVASGTCGEGVTWVLNSKGLLQISGNGKMSDYSGWSNYKGTVEEVVISEGVTEICSYAFESSNVKKVTIPATVTNIGYRAFAYCSYLPEVTIPVTVTKIDSDAFYRCGNYLDTTFVIKGYTPSYAKDYAEENYIEFESSGDAPVAIIASGECGDNLTWTLDNYGLLTVSGTGKMSYNSTSGGGFDAGAELMASYYEVPWYSVKDKIVKVVVEEGVESIEDYAFYNCHHLEEIILSSTVVSVGKEAFSNNTLLKKLTIHYNTTDIPTDVLYYTDDVVIYGYTYSRAEEIAAYYDKEFVALGDAPVVDIAFGDLTDTIKWGLNSRGVLSIYGTGDMPVYDNAEKWPWSTYSASIRTVEIRDVNLVVTNTLTDCRSVKEIVLDGVSTVEAYAFNSCNNIEKVTMSPSVRSVYRTSFGYSQSAIEYVGYRGTYAENYAEYFGAVFTPIEEALDRKTVYVSTVDELVNAIASDTVIIIEDGIYLLDRSSYLGDKEYTWEYADTIRIRDVSNLTIKARNPGKVEILAAQLEQKSNFSYENSIFCIEGGYNILVDGIRFGNINMTTSDYSSPEKDDVELMGGGDGYGLSSNYSGSYITSLDKGNYDEIVLANKVEFRNCDIFNLGNGILFYGRELKVINCTIRDTLCGAMSVTAGDVLVENTVFSHNGCSTSFKNTYCVDVSPESYKAEISGCTFINNQNPSYTDRQVSGDGNVFSDNVWDGQSAKSYGVTHNGITWLVESSTLKLGGAINRGDVTIESKTGEVYPYTVTSLPWKDYDIDKVDLAEGVTYSFVPNGACGANVVWTYDENAKTITITGTGKMSDMGYIDEWYDYDIENIVIEDTITGVYDIFTETEYAQSRDNWENGLLYAGDVLLATHNDLTGEIKVKEGTRIIADEAFYYCTLVTSIVLPESVEYIGVTEKLTVGEMGYNGVFENCNKLEKLTIPASVTEFDHAMVYNCRSLSDIYYSGTTAQWEKIAVGKRNDQLDYCIIHTSDGTVMPDPYYYTVDENGVTITGVYPFATEITIPEEVEGMPVVELAADLFTNHETLKRVTIEAKVEDAPYFTNAKELEAVTLGDGIVYIFSKAFEGCSKLNSITIKGDLKELPHDAFTDTAYYRNADNWEGGVLYVDGYASALSPDATGIVTIRSGARSISYNMFNNNDAVTEIIIPDGVKNQPMGENFYNMGALSHIRLSDLFEKSKYSFGVFDCEKLERITISDNHPTLCDVDGVVFTKDMTTLVYMPMGKTGSYEIPEGVTTIGERAFDDTHLSAVTIPESVKTISDGAFPVSYYLKDVYYNITSSQWEDTESFYIGGGNNAFNNANLHLRDCEFIEDVLEFFLNGDAYTVVGCKDYATEALIPATYKGKPVTEVDPYAFAFKERLEKIMVEEGSEYFTSAEGVVFTKDMKTLLVYPAGKADESYAIPDGVEAIASQAFAGSGNLKNVDLGSSLAAIGTWAFEGSGIVEVTIPETVSVITTGAFATMSLEKVYFGTHITSIERNAFYDGLKYIYFNGTLNEWRNVDGRYYLPSATEVVTKVEIQFAAAYKSEQQIQVELAVEGLESSQSFIMIGIDGDGGHVTYDEYYGEELYAGPLTIEGDEIEKVEKVKIFVWESLQSMKPLGAPVEIEVRR
ncbi:MAG: leucine-rich repeat protein [Clostridia bacterium]|nr:leucine-rich repeat protein [Clostridia bacterium]